MFLVCGLFIVCPPIISKGS